MGEDKILEAKKIRSVLITYQNGVSLAEFRKSYKKLVGEDLPTQKFGYDSDIDFLRSIPDVVHIVIDKRGNYQLFGIADETSKHIQRLVSRTRPSKPNCKLKYANTHPMHDKFKTVDGFNHSLPFVPAVLRVEINRVMRDFPNGLTLSSFFLAYQRLFKKSLHLENGLEALEKIISALPEFEIKDVKNEKKIFCSYSYVSGNNDSFNTEVKTKSNFELDRAFKLPPDTGSENIGKAFHSLSDHKIVDKSGISKADKLKLTKVLSNYPEGVLAVHFPPLYEKVTGETFELFKFGYNSILELADSLSDVFARKLAPESEKDWVLFPANMHEVHKNEQTALECSQINEQCIQNIRKLLKHYSPDGIELHSFTDLYEIYFNDLLPLDDGKDDATSFFLASVSDIVPLKFKVKGSIKYVYLATEKQAMDMKMQSREISVQKVIPIDAVNPVQQYIKPQFPVDIGCSQYFPIFISSVVSPGLFWFQLQTEEAIYSLRKLEDELELLYNSSLGHRFKMSDTDVMIGAACVALCPADRQWYRVVIKSAPTSDSINVSYVDYGGNSNIPRINLRYARKSFMNVPIHAFEARLACLKPSNHECVWSIKGQKRFIELCKSAKIMAQVKTVDSNKVSIFLCDTNGAQDLHINDVLIHEGYAEFCLEEDFNFTQNLLSPQPKNFELNLGTTTYCPTPVSFDNSFSSDVENSQNTQEWFLNCSSEEAFLYSDTSSSGAQSSEEICLQRRLSLSERNKIQFKPESDLVKNKEFENDNSVNKRYVKRLRLNDGPATHLIVVDSKPFVSGGDICALLWDDKDADFLAHRLKYKEVNIPTVTVSSDKFKTLFEQCQRYSVKGIQESNTNILSLTLYPLNSVISILNTFGHPSALVRQVFDNETKKFNPFDENFLSHNDDLNYTEDINVTADKLGKLCLYDLKIMHEGLNCKRLKIINQFENTKNEGIDKELEKIENAQSIIEKRMKDIEAICSSFS